MLGKPRIYFYGLTADNVMVPLVEIIFLVHSPYKQLQNQAYMPVKTTIMAVGVSLLSLVSLLPLPMSARADAYHW